MQSTERNPSTDTKTTAVSNTSRQHTVVSAVDYPENRNSPDTSRRTVLEIEAETTRVSEMNTSSGELLDVKDVARLLKIGERTVHRFRDMGTMPAPIKLGRLIRWPRKVIQEWIEQGCPSTVRAS